MGNWSNQSLLLSYRECGSYICLIAAFDPTKRLSVETALAQPFLAEYYDPADEPTAEKPFQYEVIKVIFLISFILFNVL